MYIAGNSHLVRMTKKTEPTIIAALKKLCEKGFIEKVPVIVNKVERNYYKAIGYGLNNLSGGTKEILGGYLNNLSGGTKKILAPIKKDNIKENIKENKRLSNDNPKTDESFDKFWEAYGYKKSKQSAFNAWKRLSDKDKKKALENIPLYLQDCKRNQRSIQYPATYLNKKTFNDDFDTIPEYYQNNENDTSTEARYKRYMIQNFRNLIYHRNPLTFEQYIYLVEEYNESDMNIVSEALEKLCGMEYNQFISIEFGLKKILKEMKEERVYGNE